MPITRDDIIMRAKIASMLLAMILFSKSGVYGQEIRIRVELVDVQCVMDTETVYDSDLFYAVTALSGGNAESALSAVNRPIPIRYGETKTFGKDQRVIFDAKVPARGTVRGGIKAFNQDTPVEWPKCEEFTKKATQAIAVAAAKPGAKARDILKAALEALKGGITSDYPLGEIEINIAAEGPPEETKSWRFVEKAVAANTYDYTVRYRVVRTR